MDTITYPNQAPIQSNHKKNQTLLYVFLGLIVVLSIIYLIMVKQRVAEPTVIPYSIEDRLLQLEKLKNPEPSPYTIEERVEALDDLGSENVAQVSIEERLSALEALSQGQ